MSSFQWLRFLTMFLFFSADGRVVAQPLGVNPSAAASDVRNPSSTNPSAAASDIRNPSATNPSAAASQIPQPSAISSRRDNVAPSTGSQRIAPQTRRARAVQQGRRERVKSRDANAGGEIIDHSKPLRAQGATASSLSSERRTIRSSSSGWKKSKKLNRPARREARPQPSALKVLVRPPPLRLRRRRFRRALLDRIVHRSLDAPLLDRCGG